jgi:hypothetical protein
MINQIRASLRAWRPNGGSISPDELVRLFATDVSKFEVVGSGKPWQASRIVFLDLSSGSFKTLEEPSEGFYDALLQSLLVAAAWLANVSAETMKSLRQSGLMIDVFFDISLDDNQIQLKIPPELSLQLGRLELPVEILSND